MLDNAADAGSPAQRRGRARRGEGDRLRAEIVDAASELLAATGEVGELSLRAVAREVGVAATSIYLHFANLNELILAVKQRYFEEFGAVLDAAADATGTRPESRTRARAHAYVRYGLDNPGRYRVMFLSAMVPWHRTSGAPYLGEPAFVSLRADIAGAIESDGNADMVAVHLWTAMHGSVTLRAARPNFPWPDIDAEIDSLVAGLLRGA